MSRSGAFSEVRLGRLHAFLDRLVAQGRIAGAVALVSRHDEVHTNIVGFQDLETRTPMRRDTIFRFASISKPITAAAAMILVEEAKLRLDDPVDDLLPELANRRVLRTIESAIGDTVPAHRSIMLRDLLTFRPGFGMLMAPPGKYPIQQAFADAGLAPGPKTGTQPPADLVQRLGVLPLMHQPGTTWMYHTSSDILGVLIERAAGMRFEDFLAERLFAPLGMKDTGFYVPEAKLDRLATAYRTDPSTGGLTVYDPARGGDWARPPVLAAGGGGLAGTADDYLAFARMLLNLGRGGGDRILARPSVALMTADHITAEQKAASPFFPGFWDNRGWGFGLAVIKRREDIATSPGAYEWNGGFGTAWRNDPAEDMVTILLTQRMMTGPEDTAIYDDFFTLAYQAIED